MRGGSLTQCRDEVHRNGWLWKSEEYRLLCEPGPRRG